MGATTKRSQTVRQDCIELRGNEFYPCKARETASNDKDTIDAGHLVRIVHLDHLLIGM